MDKLGKRKKQKEEQRAALIIKKAAAKEAGRAKATLGMNLSIADCDTVEEKAKCRAEWEKRIAFLDRDPQDQTDENQ